MEGLRISAKNKIIKKKRIRWKFCNWNRSSQERFDVMWNLSKDIQTHTYMRQESEEHFKRRTWGDKGLCNYRTWISEITVDGFEVGMSGRDENWYQNKRCAKPLDVDVMWEGEYFSD